VKNWKDYHNYRKYENTDGSYTFVIYIDGEAIEVNEEIYTEYAQISRKMKYMELDLKRDRVKQDANRKTVKDSAGLPIVLPEREMSLDRLIDDLWEFPSNDPSLEEIVCTPAESEEAELHRCITLLSVDEQALIKALFFEGKTERQYAEIIGISKTALHARKKKVLLKIKNFLLTS